MSEKMESPASNPPPKQKAKQAHEPRQRGIGDNSQDKPQDDDVSLETIAKRLAFAQEKAAALGSVFMSNKAQMEATGIDALSAIYNVAYEINKLGAYDAFLTKYGISVHGNVRSPWQVIVAYSFVECPDRIFAKSTISKMGAIVSYGIAAKLSPTMFTEQARSAGVENLYQKCKPSSPKAELTEAQHEQLAKAAFPERPDAPLCSDPQILGDCADERIFVGTGDGAGNFRVRAMLDHSSPEVTRLLSAIARKRLAQ